MRPMRLMAPRCGLQQGNGAALTTSIRGGGKRLNRIMLQSS